MVMTKQRRSEGGVLVCGALGIAGLLMMWIAMLPELRRCEPIIASILQCYMALSLCPVVIALLIGWMAFVKPPLRMRRAGVALTAFLLELLILLFWNPFQWGVLTGDLQWLWAIGWILAMAGAALGIGVAVMAMRRLKAPRDQATGADEDTPQGAHHA
jgi:uncharacterized membrane protein YozB (DUF420 family)